MRSKDSLGLYEALLLSNKHLSELDLQEGIMPSTQFISSEPDFPILLLQNVLENKFVYVGTIYFKIRIDKTIRTILAPSKDEVYYLLHLPDRKFFKYFSDLKNVGIFYEDEIISPHRIFIGNLDYEGVDLVIKRLSKKCLWRYNKAISEAIFRVTEGRLSSLRFFIKHLKRATNRREIMTQIDNYEVDLKEFVESLVEDEADKFARTFQEKLQKYGFNALKVAVLDYLKLSLFSELKDNAGVPQKEVLETSEVMDLIGRANNEGSFINAIFKLFYLIRR